MEKLVLTNEQAKELVKEYGSPLYVYDENILRKCCKDMMNVIKHKNFRPHYSTKANSNIELLKIIRDEGMCVDAMSIGEMEVVLAAGFDKSQIMFVSNNNTIEELKYVIDKGVDICLDSISQLDTYGQLNPGGRACIRINAGHGVGHSDKVVTAGKCKFGVELPQIDKIKETAAKHNVKIIGLHQHLGSLFLDGTEFIKGTKELFDVAMQFEDLEFVDLGGGFGMPYEGQPRLDIDKFAADIQVVIDEFVANYSNKDIVIKTEPGRYVVCECGHLLGTVTSEKENYGMKYYGSNLGFSVLIRPAMYDSYHNVVAYNDETEEVVASLAGNICESGDIIARERKMKKMNVGDIVGVMDAGAYGYAMASNYNCRQRPAEVLIEKNGSVRLIRKRDTYESMVNQL